MDLDAERMLRRLSERQADADIHSAASALGSEPIALGDAAKMTEAYDDLDRATADWAEIVNRGLDRRRTIATAPGNPTSTGDGGQRRAGE